MVREVRIFRVAGPFDPCLRSWLEGSILVRGREAIVFQVRVDLVCGTNGQTHGCQGWAIVM